MYDCSVVKTWVIAFMFDVWVVNALEFDKEDWPWKCEIYAWFINSMKFFECLLIFLIDSNSCDRYDDRLSMKLTGAKKNCMDMASVLQEFFCYIKNLLNKSFLSHIILSSESCLV